MPDTRWQDLTDQQRERAERRLTEHQYLAIMLKDVAHRSYTDIAVVLRIHRNAAISRVKAARHVLEQIIQQEAA